MTFDMILYTVSESDMQVVITVVMVENNTLIDVTINFRTTDNTAIGI